MPPHSRKRRKRRSSQQSIDKLSQFIEKTSIPATLPSINKDRSISHENNEVKSQRIERIANSPRRLAKTAAWSNKNKLASDFHSKTQTLTKMKDGSEKTDADGNYVSPRRKSVSERFQMIQHKVGTMGALQNGGARRRASIRIEEKPLSQEQRRSILDKIGSLDVLSDDAKDKFADALQARVYGKGEKIIEEGEIGAEFYIIEIGKVEVTRSDPINYGQEKVLAKLGNHDFFGEIALLVDAPRSATVRTLETTTVLYAGRDIFQKLMSPIQESVSKTRKNELMNAVLTNVSLFNPLTPLEQRKLIDVMGNAQYKEGDVICRQGDIGNSMYIILEGAVKVMIPTGKNDDDDDDDDDNDDNDNNGNKGKKKSFRHMKKKEVFRYHRFGYFGELALVNADSKRTADCVAVGDCKCLFLHRIHFNSCPRLAEAIGLKNMFQGFGSRKQVESDNAEVRKMRRRQSFVSTKGSGDEEDEDEEADANGSTKSSRAGSPKGSPSGSPRSRRGSTSSFDDNENEGLMSAFNFNKKSTNRSRSNSKIMGMFGGGAGGKMSLKSKVQSMIKKKRTSDFMALVHEAIQKKKELRANLCTPVIERVHVKPELMDRFTEISSKIDWIDRENGADDLMKHVRIALSTLPVQRTEEQVGLIYTVIENLNVWNTMCPNVDKRDMMNLSRFMNYERHNSPDNVDNNRGRSGFKQFDSSIIYKQHDSGNKMYIILEGSVLSKRTMNIQGRMKHKTLPQLKYANSFGELSLMGMNQRRETTEVEAHGASFITISAESYIKHITHGGETMTVEAKFKLLQQCRIFKAMDPCTFEMLKSPYKLFRLSLFFEPKDISEGCILTKEQEPASSLYIVREGFIDLVRARVKTSNHTNSTQSKKNTKKDQHDQKKKQQNDTSQRKRKEQNSKNSKKSKKEKKEPTNQSQQSKQRHADIDATFATAPSKVSIAKFLENNLIVATISKNSSLGITSFLNSNNKDKKKRFVVQNKVEPVTAIAKTRCKLLVLPPQHFRRLPRKLIEEACIQEHFLLSQHHINSGKHILSTEKKQLKRDKRQASIKAKKLNQERQQKALLDSMQRVAAVSLNGAESTTNPTMSNVREVSKVAVQIKTIASHMLHVQHEKNDQKTLQEIRSKSAQLSTNVYIKPLSRPIGNSTITKKKEKMKNTLHLSSLGRKVRKRIVESGLISEKEDQIGRHQHDASPEYNNDLDYNGTANANGIANTTYTTTNNNYSNDHPGMNKNTASKSSPLLLIQPDLIGRMACNENKFAGLMQEVFGDTKIYNKNQIILQRRERLRQHAIGSSSTPVQKNGSLPNLYRTPSSNLKKICSHLRKHSLNHVPGRHSGPPVVMPAWLRDGKRELKLPRRGQSLNDWNNEVNGVIVRNQDSHPLSFL